jgi:hypothetical protein
MEGVTEMELTVMLPGICILKEDQENKEERLDEGEMTERRKEISELLREVEHQQGKKDSRNQEAQWVT